MYWQRTFPPLLARGLSTIYLLPIYCRLIRLLITEIGAPKCTNLLLSIYVCFLTGFASAASFSTYFVWRSFQTGNAAQLGLSIAGHFRPWVKLILRGLPFYLGMVVLAFFSVTMGIQSIIGKEQ